MVGFDYGNARLRAMKSRLLARRELETLASAKSLQGLLSALLKTAYQKPLETALARVSGMDCLEQALHSDLVHSVRKIRAFYNGQAEAMVSTILRKYDIHNLKAVLRGIEKHASSAEIRAALLPIGELLESLFLELARAPDPRSVIDLAASMRLPMAQPLIGLRADKPDTTTVEMERVLDQWHYRAAFQRMEELRRKHALVLEALQVEVDMANLLTALRVIHDPPEHRTLLESLGAQTLRDLFLESGHLSIDRLDRAASQATFEALVDALAGTRYETPLRQALDDFRATARLSAFEKRLKRFHLRWKGELIFKDPLGIGMFIGFLALKLNEIRNLRWIARGILLGLRVDQIRMDMEYAA